MKNKMFNKNHDELMYDLADQLDLTYDGNDERLFFNESHAETLKLTKREYEAMEKKIDKFIIKGQGFEVYAWNDISGYNYWTKNEKTDNYIQITAYIKNPNQIDIFELNKALNKANDYFLEYRDDYWNGLRNFKPKGSQMIKKRLGVK